MIKKNTKQKDADQLLSKMKSYSMLAAGMLAGATQGESAVVYTDVDPDDFIFSFDQFNIDLDGDAVTDIYIGLFSFYTMPGSNTSFYSKSVYASGAQYGNGIQGFYFGASALQQGSNISANQAFNSFGSMARINFSSYSGTSNFYASGDWYYNANTERFLGVQFDISGQTHYGWIRLIVDNTLNVVTLLDYAYESTPNQKITAGDTGDACQAPGNISFTAFTYNSVTYNWDPFGSATSYEIRGRVAPLGGQTPSPYITLPISDPNQASLQINNLTPGTIYGIEIRSFCGTDTSAWTNELFFQPPECNAPDTTFVTNLTSNSVTLNWTLDGGPGTPAAYNILGRAVGSSAITSLNVPHPTNTFQVNNLPSGVAFEWAVVTVCTPNNSVRSGFSPVNVFTTLGNAEKAQETNTRIEPQGMTIAPNPITSVSQVRFDNDEGASYQLTLTDMSGKVVRIINNINNNLVSIEKGNLASGMYVLELKGKAYFVDKILIE